MTPAEILLATDAELNEYMGLKKYAPYRKPGKDRWDIKNKRREQLNELKRKIAERSGQNPHLAMSQWTEEQGEVKKKRKGKKERMRVKAGITEDATAIEPAVEEETKGEVSKKRTKSQVEEKTEELEDAHVEDDADGPKKKKRRRYKKASGTAE